jgi:hypothetical protein
MNVLIYADDLLICSELPELVMQTLSKVYRFKEDPKSKGKWDRQIDILVPTLDTTNYTHQ